MLGDSGGCDEYIDQKHGRFREIKAAGGRASALNWNRFRRQYGENLNHVPPVFHV
jgi:hypothetical protein